MSVDGLEYGAVIFTAGKLAGRLGYYDDDEVDKAIVYLGKPFESEYVTVPFSSIRNITSLEHEKFKKENSEFCSVHNPRLN